MNKLTKIFISIGSDPGLFWAGWLAGMVGAILGTLLFVLFWRISYGN